MKKRFGIIAVTYGEYFKESFLHSILEQTYKNFDLHIYHDGEDICGWENRLSNTINGNTVFWHNTEKRMNQFGHDLRDLGIKEQADKYEWLIITNCDNYYVPKFLEELNMMVNQFGTDRGIDQNYNHFLPAGVILFDYIHSHNRVDSSSGGTYGFMNNQFRPSICDIGAFAVCSDLALEVGFNRRDHDADAGFIQEILDLQPTKGFGIVKLPKVLFIHN